MVKEMNEQRYFGDWVIESHLGSGSYGDVYKIKKEEFGITYYSAMKVIKIPQDKNEQKQLCSSGMDSKSIDDYYYHFAKDFIKEIELMAKLQGNTNIVDYNDHIIEQNEDGVGYVIYIRMEFLTPLDSYLSANNQPRFMTQKEIVKLGIDICSALEICSKMKIIHRDIKPENIFVSPNGDFKIGDFGIARNLEKTQSGLSRKGTINYMAPEVYLGEEYGESVDVYSLGIVLYRLLNCNRVPFLPLYPEQIKYTDSEIAFTRRINGETIPYINGIDERLNKIVIKACEADPKNRYHTAKELKKDLLAVYPTLNDEQEQPGLDFSDETTVLESNPAEPVYSDETVVIGAPVYEEVPVEPETPEESAPQPEPQPVETPVQTEAPKKKSKKKIAIIVAALAVIIVIGIIVSGGKSGKKNNTYELSTNSINTTVTTTGSVSTTVAATESTTQQKPDKVKISEITSENYGALTLKWSKSYNADGYSVQISESKDMKDPKKVNVKGALKTSETVSDLKQGKTYYVKIRAYINGSDGKKVYSSWSDVKSVTTKAPPTTKAASTQSTYKKSSSYTKKKSSSSTKKKSSSSSKKKSTKKKKSSKASVGSWKSVN